MYHPTTRMLDVLELLQTTPQLTGPELAARLEVDVRTVRRYITMLQDMGIPIEATIGRFGGYMLRPGYKLAPLMLTDEEAVVVTLGVMTIERMGDRRRHRCCSACACKASTRASTEVADTG